MEDKVMKQEVFRFLVVLPTQKIKHFCFKLAGIPNSREGRSRLSENKKTCYIWFRSKVVAFLSLAAELTKTIIFAALPEKQYWAVLFWLNFSNHGKALINPKNIVVQYNTKTIPEGFLTRLWNSTPCLLSQCPEVACRCYQFSAAIERISWHSSAKMAQVRGGLWCWSR